MFRKKLIQILIILFSLFWTNHSNATKEILKEDICKINQASQMVREGNLEQHNLTEKLLINCIRVQPKNVEAMILLAKLIEQQVSQEQRPIFDIQKSVSLVSQAFFLEPENPKSRIAMSHALLIMGQYEESQNLLEETIVKYPNAKESLLEKARIISSKDPDKALSLLHDAVNLGLNTDEIIDILVTCARYKSNLDNYSKIFHKIAEDFPNKWMYFKLAAIYADEGDLSKAIHYYEKSREMGNFLESTLQLAIIEYQKLNLPKNAILNLNLLLKNLENQGHYSNHSVAIVYSHLSLAHFYMKDYKSASKFATKMVEKNYSDKELFKSLVTEYKSRNSLYILKDALLNVTLNDPAYDLSYALLSEIYKKSKNYLTSLDYIEKALSVNPKSDSFYAIKASIHSQLKHYDKALSSLDKALELNPGTILYLYNKACILSNLGRKSEALFYLETVLNSDKKYLEIARNDPDFDGIKSDSQFSRQFASLFFQKYDNKWAATEPN